MICMMLVITKRKLHAKGFVIAVDRHALGGRHPCRIHNNINRCSDTWRSYNLNERVKGSAEIG